MDADAAAALQLLGDLLAEFAFAPDGGVSRAAALSLLVTGVARSGMDISPMFIIQKPAPGTGGSYLADLSAAISLGARAAVMAWSTSAEENEKRLIAAALEQ